MRVLVDKFAKGEKNESIGIEQHLRVAPIAMRAL
jgi:hypothetical protein